MAQNPQHELTLAEAIAKAKELQAEIEARIAALPEPPPKGEFERQEDYDARLARHATEIQQIRQPIETEIREGLDKQKFAFEETEVVLELGTYDADSETFPAATLRLKEPNLVPDFSWNFRVPLQYAERFKEAVTDGTAKIRAYVDFKAFEGRAEVEVVLVEDPLQGHAFGNLSDYIRSFELGERAQRMRELLIHIGAPALPGLKTKAENARDALKEKLNPILPDLPSDMRQQATSACEDIDALLRANTIAGYLDAFSHIRRFEAE